MQNCAPHGNHDTDIDLSRIARILRILLQPSELEYTPWQDERHPRRLKGLLQKYGLFKFNIPAELDDLQLLVPVKGDKDFKDDDVTDSELTDSDEEEVGDKDEASDHGDASNHEPESDDGRRLPPAAARRMNTV